MPERRSIRPGVVWLTGLSGAGKSTIAMAARDMLAAASSPCVVLDGDVIRAGLCRDLGFSPAERHENIRRVAHVARLAGEEVPVIAALITPMAADRALAREIVGPVSFWEVFVDTPLDVAEARDPKGHYARARRGELRDFTGVSAPYEAPQAPDLSIRTLGTDPLDLARAVIEATFAAR